VLTRQLVSPYPKFDLSTIFPHCDRMLSVSLSLSVAAVAGALVYALWRVAGVSSYKIEPPPPAAEPITTSRLRDLELEMERLQEAVAHGITQVSRNENRIQKTVTSARRLVREAGLEHAGVEAEYEELQSRDGEAVEALPAMPEEVGQTRTIRVPGGHLTIGAA